jgi:transposase
MPPNDRHHPKRADSSESRYSLMEFMRDFPDDATCLEWLWVTRYSPDGKHAECPKCELRREFKRYETSQRRQSWTCTACGFHLHPTAGTIFHKSSTSLHLWFYAMYLMTSTRCGISAKQLERELGVTYKTAWRMFTLIRNELMTQDDDEPLAGAIEADETYVGGKRRKGKTGRPGRGDRNKTPVFGMAERGGRVVASKVPDASALSLMRQIEKRVLSESVAYTDEWKSYNRLARSGCQHRRIHHAQEIYAMGDMHTNTIEGLWSLVKRGIARTHHAVSARWLQGYLNEYAWRYNHRDDGQAMFLTLRLRSATTSL